MTWKKLNNAHFGSSTTFGGADIDKISRLFDGTPDIDEQDINSSTTIRSGKFKFRNPADIYSYTVTPSAIVADRTVIMPQLASDSEFLFVNTPQTISNKTLSNCVINNPTSINMGTGGIGDPIIKRWGFYQPIAKANTPSNVGELGGILAGHSLAGASASNGWDTLLNGGLSALFNTDTSTNDVAGIVPNPSAVPTFRTREAGRFQVIFAQNHSLVVEYIFGLADMTAFYSGSPPILTTNSSGIVFSNLQDDTYFLTTNNGNGTVQVNTLVGGFAGVTTPHVVDVSWPAGGNQVTVTLDNTITKQVNTKLPDPDTEMYFHAMVRTREPAAKGVKIYKVYIESE